MRVTDESALQHSLQEPHARAGWHRPVAGAIVVLGVAVVLTIGLLGLPRDEAPLPAIARHAMQIAMPVWGQAEVVSEVVYGSRGFDTFGETFLLLAAVIAVTTLARPREPRNEYVGEASAGRRSQRTVDRPDPGGPEEQGARSAEQNEESEGEDPAAPNPDTDPLGKPAPERAVGMTIVVRVAVRIAAVMLSVAAIYTAAWGWTPGGGFPAGAAVMGVALLLYVGLGHRAVRAAVRPSTLEPIEQAGAIGIVIIGLLGLVLKGSMFANFVPLAQPLTIRAGGTEQLYSGAELVEVATGLTIAVFSLLGMGRDWMVRDDSPDDDGDGEPEGSDPS